jgi:hypothetical protein
MCCSYYVTDSRGVEQHNVFLCVRRVLCGKKRSVVAERISGSTRQAVVRVRRLVGDFPDEHGLEPFGDLHVGIRVVELQLR